MTTKELLAAAGQLAEVVIALIAVSPFLQRAVSLIRTAPPTNADQVLQDLKLRARMGPVQGAWFDFLHWARRVRPEPLTWRELLYRKLLCPLGSHHGKIRKLVSPSGTGFEVMCDDCRDWQTSDSEEALRRWLEKGKETWEARPLRQRIDPDTAKLGEFANKLADAINSIVPPPR